MQIPANLLEPVPPQDGPLTRKHGYRQYALDLDDPRGGEPLVDIATYNIAGQSYYSRPNNATRKPVKGIPQTVFVRQNIAARVAQINEAVKHSSMLAELFEGEVELYVDEGLRSQRMQRQLYEEVFPRLIREQFPDMNDKQVLERRDQMIAKPATDPHLPSPHATGAAIDLKLRYRQDTKLFVPDSEVFMAHAGADMSTIVRPNAFEREEARTDEARKAQRNRRIFYWIMQRSGGIGHTVTRCGLRLQMHQPDSME
jgi:D-alanyl-D-alanine dipeptidase